MADFKIGTEFADGKFYAGPNYGFVEKQKYQELLKDGSLGRGEQTAQNLLKSSAHTLGKIRNSIPKVKKTKNGGKRDRKRTGNGGYFEKEIKDGLKILKPVASTTLKILDAPVTGAHWLSKKVDPTGRGIGKTPLTMAEIALSLGGGAAKKGITTGGKNLLTKIDDVSDALKSTKQLAGATVGQVPVNRRLKIPKNGNGGNGLNGAYKPLQMTADEAGQVYGKVRNKEIGADLTGLQRSADPDITRIARKHEANQLDDLSRRQHNSYTASSAGSDPVKYLTKYFESRGLKAEAHHILDHDFWGQALNSPNGQIAGEALWTKGVKSGNDATNLVSSWSAKTKGYDHETLHRLYKSIDKRNTVLEMMNKGIWHKQSPEYQAKVLREVADRQYRLTANFYRIKLAAIKRNNPKLLKLSPQQLKEEIFKNPQKYAEIDPIKGFDYKNPEHVKGFQAQLNAIPHSGKVTEEMKVVFGLDIPKAGAKEWKGTANQKRFDLTIGPLTKRIERNKKKLNINK